MVSDVQMVEIINTISKFSENHEKRIKKDINLCIGELNGNTRNK